MCGYLEMGGEANWTYLGIKRLSAKQCIIPRKEGFSGVIKISLASTTEELIAQNCCC